jgi:hypothetical protein
METNEKNEKSTWLMRKISSLSLKWQIISIWLMAVGLFATVMYLVDIAIDLYDDIVSDNYYVTGDMDGYEVHNYYDGRKCIAKEGSHRAVIDDIEWVNGDSSDSLWVVAKDERRAYFNTKTGKLAIPFTYLKAWRYSEGLAAVVDENNQLLFIDTQGNPAFKNTFKYMGYFDYIFKVGMCPMVDTTGKVGLIDISGNWVVEPRYDSVAFVSDADYNYNYWSLMRGDSLMVIDSVGRTIIDMTPGHELRLTTEGGLEIWHRLRPGKLYDNFGNLLANQTYWNVKNIEYYNEYDKENARVLAYYTDYDHCGMLTPDGQVLTDAKYSEIESISENLFRAKYNIAPEDDDYLCLIYGDYPSTYVLLNSKGELVEGKSSVTNKE